MGSRAIQQHMSCQWAVVAQPAVKTYADDFDLLLAQR
jgi:hypothetical protein